VHPPERLILAIRTLKLSKELCSLQKNCTVWTKSNLFPKKVTIWRNQSIKTHLCFTGRVKVQRIRIRGHLQTSCWIKIQECKNWSTNWAILKVKRWMISKQGFPVTKIVSKIWSLGQDRVNLWANMWWRRRKILTRLIRTIIWWVINKRQIGRILIEQVQVRKEICKLQPMDLERILNTKISSVLVRRDRKLTFRISTFISRRTELQWMLMLNHWWNKFIKKVV
jgi:hypothetical protein